MVTPVEGYILVEQEELKSSHIILQSPTVKNVVWARVIACGPGNQRPDGGRFAMPCRPGDRIQVGSGAGTRCELDGKKYWYIRQMSDDVYAVEVPD